MLKHIVMWKLRTGRQDESTLAGIRVDLVALVGEIPGLLKMEFGINLLDGDDAPDVVLYSEFTDRAALAVYQAHPRHQVVAALVRSLATERRSVDYER